MEKVNQAKMNSLIPNRWSIEKNPKPIPDRRFDFDFWHEDYDGSDGGNGLSGTASSVEDAVNQIKDIELSTAIECT